MDIFCKKMHYFQKFINFFLFRNFSSVFSVVVIYSFKKKKMFHNPGCFNSFLQIFLIFLQVLYVFSKKTLKIPLIEFVLTSFSSIFSEASHGALIFPGGLGARRKHLMKCIPTFLDILENITKKTWKKHVFHAEYRRILSIEWYEVTKCEAIPMGVLVFHISLSSILSGGKCWDYRIKRIEMHNPSQVKLYIDSLGLWSKWI